MTDVAEKSRFSAIDLRQCFGSLAFVLISARVGYGCGDLCRYQFKKTSVKCVESKSRAYARYEDAGEIVLLVRANRNDDRAVGRLRPGTLRNTIETRIEIFHDHDALSSYLL